MQWISPIFAHIGLAAKETKKKGLSLISAWGQMAQKDLDEDDGAAHNAERSSREQAKAQGTDGSNTHEPLKDQGGELDKSHQLFRRQLRDLVNSIDPES